jgi:hypothetical protein
VPGSTDWRNLQGQCSLGRGRRFGHPKEQGELFFLRKGGHRTAVCKLFSHQFGWKCRLLVGRELVQSQVCRSQEEVVSTGEQWKAQ